MVMLKTSEKSLFKLILFDFVLINLTLGTSGRQYWVGGGVETGTREFYW